MQVNLLSDIEYVKILDICEKKYIYIHTYIYIYI